MGDFWGRLFDTAGFVPHKSSPRDYIIAVLAGLLAVLARAALDPFLASDHAFVLSLLAVVYVGWQCGFGPGIVTLLLSMGGVVYYFVSPRESFNVERQSDQVAVAAFLFCGVACSALGHAQRTARRRAKAALAESEARRVELEAEIARRVELEAELRESEQRFRSLAENIPQLVWTTDPAGTPTYYNPRWHTYTGRAVGELQPGDGVNLIHPDERERVAADWSAARRTGTDRMSQEFRLRRGDGEYRWQKGEAVALRDAAGAVTQWIGTLSDIDDQKRQAEMLERVVRERTTDLIQQVEERRRAEDKVQATARELQRSNGELEQFAYVASHDLQEPLRKIQAFGDLLQTKYATALPAPGREYVQKMQGSAGRMSKLIDDLLTYSRVTTQARPFVPTDLAKVVADVLDDLETRVEKAGGKVEVGQLPVIDADPTQMRQLFQNLLGNALKFARPDTPPAVTVRATVLAQPGGNGHPAGVCRVEVADNGIGFDEKHAERIFQVFQRLHGRGEYEGTGVGLAICKKIADRHNGTITAASRPGEGATFTVTLPVRHTPTP